MELIPRPNSATEMNFTSAFESQKAWSGRAGARNQIRKEQLRAPKHLKREHVWACEEEYLRESQTSKKFWKRLDVSSSRIVNHPRTCTPSLLPPLLPPLLHLPLPLPRALPPCQSVPLVLLLCHLRAVMHGYDHPTFSYH